MICDETEILLHALIDGELDAGNARAVETHLATCPRCAARLQAYRDLHDAMTTADLGFKASPQVRRRIEAALPSSLAPTRRSLIKGVALGSAVSALAATGLVMAVLGRHDDQRLLSEVVSAHLRSLQAGHLTDVESSDQHTVKPWFNGKLDVAPPTIDLTAQGFTLLGGRLDYLDGRPVGSVVYRRRTHVINLFVAPAEGATRPAKLDTVQGFNIRSWSEHGLQFWAISDIEADELREFGDRLAAGLQSSGER
jgi:anti-sigma factor RsiW